MSAGKTHRSDSGYTHKSRIVAGLLIGAILLALIVNGPLSLRAQTVPTPTPIPPAMPTPVPTPTPFPTPTPIPTPTSLPSPTPVAPPTSPPTSKPSIQPSTATPPARQTPTRLPATATPTPVAEAKPTATPSPTPTATRLALSLAVVRERPYVMVFPGETITVSATLKNLGPATGRIPLRFLVPEDVAGWDILSPPLRLDAAQSAWIVDAWPTGTSITLTLRLTARSDVPLGRVSDVILFWPGTTGDEHAVLATLAFPPDHLPAVGGAGP